MQEENLIEVNQMNIFKGSYDKLFLNGSLGSTPNNGAATMLFKFFWNTVLLAKIRWYKTLRLLFSIKLFQRIIDRVNQYLNKNIDYLFMLLFIFEDFLPVRSFSDIMMFKN